MIGRLQNIGPTLAPRYSAAISICNSSLSLWNRGMGLRLQ